MKNEWNTLDINQLQHLYKECSRKLRYSLLRGARWQEIKDQRRDVTELAITIHERLNPAEAVLPLKTFAKKWRRTDR